MFALSPQACTNKQDHYANLAEQARSLISGEPDLIANAANFSALVFHSLPQLNWAGFYFFDGAELVVGPFQGKPACIRIAIGSGVCGTAARTRQTQVVHDVTQFSGHIPCDSTSQSEIVVPLVRQNGSLLGVWDCDSFVIGRFDDADRHGMETLCRIFMDHGVADDGISVPVHAAR